MKKAAMFGLDARIALAIFGALSVISGAALYSAIQDAKITAGIVSLEEISKALIQFNLDTGQDLPSYSAQTRDASELVKATVDGSKGPYLPYEDTGNGFTFIMSLLGDSEEYIHIYNCMEPFGGLAGTVACNTCDGSSTCAPWVKLGHFDESIYTALEEKIDGNDGYDKGKFRVQWVDVGKTESRLFYKLTARNLSQ